MELVGARAEVSPEVSPTLSPVTGHHAALRSRAADRLSRFPPDVMLIRAGARAPTAPCRAYRVSAAAATSRYCRRWL